MKLVFATLIAGVISTAASAMVAPTNSDPRDAAQNALGQITTGVQSTVSAKQLALDGRSLATRVGDQLNVYTFERSERPVDSTDIR